MSALGSLYIKLGEPEGEISGCCDLSDWAAEEIERLSAINSEMLEALQHVLRCIPIGGFAQIHHGSSTWAQIDAAITKAIGPDAQLLNEAARHGSACMGSWACFETNKD